MKQLKVYPQVKCPICSTVFAQERSNKKHCSRKCQKNSAQKSKVRVRDIEYKKRNTQHYQLADRLTKTLATLPVVEYHHCIQTILKTAASGYAKLRNVLLDPTLLKQRDSVALQVRIYCNTYLRESTRNSILNSDRTYSMKNFLNRNITPLLRRDYPTEMTKEQVRDFEELLGDLWSWEAKAKALPVYIPRAINPNLPRSAPEIEFIEILDNRPPLPQVEIVLLQDTNLDCSDLIDDDDDWNVEYQEYVFKKAA